MATPKATEGGVIPPDHRVFIYRIDAQDRVSFANGDWYAFARENGASELTASALIGRPLSDFLCHTETKHLLEILIQKVRRTQMTMVLPYRCDSPDCRRFMELTVLPLPQSEVEFRSRILREERREAVRLLGADTARTEASLTMCGWCKKIALPDGRWEEVEVAVAELDLFAAPSLPQIFHDICPQCGAAFSRWRHG
ncbi:MAG TPA: hypothetical protein VMB21_05700 [Candidatus Limnocylindria bacterium]|nr:hypothetical protein [Candidatus Limnocylindria bacterium]